MGCSRRNRRKRRGKRENPSASPVEIVVGTSACELRNPPKVVSEIVRKALTTRCVDSRQTKKGTLLSTRKYPCWAWEYPNGLRFVRGHLSRAVQALHKASIEVSIQWPGPNQLQFAALRTLRNRPPRTVGDHVFRFRRRLSHVHQWANSEIDDWELRIHPALHHSRLLDAGINDFSLLGEQALLTIAATPMGQFVFQEERRRLGMLYHLLSLLPPTETLVVCRNDQAVAELVSQIRETGLRHPNRPFITLGGAADSGRGSVDCIPLARMKQLRIVPRWFPSHSGVGAHLPRLVIFWEAGLASTATAQDFLDKVGIFDCSRFVFGMQRKLGHPFDEMRLEHICGPMVWHETRGFKLPEIMGSKS